jgi:uncharacterized damage-inducible protein DinB
MTADIFRTLYDYSYWARDRVWGCCDALSDEQVAQDLGYSWGSIHDVWVHLMDAERIWFQRLRGLPTDRLRPTAEFPTREALRAEWRTVEAGVRDYLATLTDAMLTSELVYRTSSGTEMRNPVWMSLMQVVNHGTDHRAQVLAMVHQLGFPTLEVDFILFVRQPR